MKKYFILIFCLFFLPFYGMSQWLNANPGAGGQVQHVVCDPNHTGRMYLCSDMEGFYVSDDFGDHWTYKGWEAPYSFIFNIAVEPGNSNRLYLASSQGLAITDDAGESWQEVSRFFNMSIATITVDPNNMNKVCFAESWMETVIGDKQGKASLWFTKDRGETWDSSTLKSYTSDKNVFSITFYPDPDKKDVLVAISDGIFISSDDLNSWQEISAPPETKACRGCDLTPDGKWLYAVYIRDDGKTGVYVKKYDGGTWQELDAKGILQSVNQTHWRPEVWSGSDERKHYVLFSSLGAQGDYNDNALNEGRFLVEGEKVYGHVNRIFKVQGANEPFDVGWNAYWSHCRTNQYYPKSWEVDGISRGVFTMCSQSTFRGDAAQPGNWIVNTCHLHDVKNLHKFYRTNGTASTWVWDIAGVDNYVVMGMGDNGFVESWDNGFSWTQKFAPYMWNVDALEVVKGEKIIVLAGRTNGFGGALDQNKGWLYYREVDTENPQEGWVSVIDGNEFSDLKGLDPSLNRIATIQSDPYKKERVYVGTNRGLYVTENIYELIKDNPQYYFKNISEPVIGTTLTRRVHVDPNDENILFLRCWKGTFRIKKGQDGTYTFTKLKVEGSDLHLADGWGHNGDITVWAMDSLTTCLMVTRNISPDWEVWMSYDKGNSFVKVLDKERAFGIRPPENNWYKGQSPVIYGGLCGKDSTFFSTVHLRGGGEGVTKGISVLKGTIHRDRSISLTDFTGDPKAGGNWFPAARSGKIWNDGTGKAAVHLATMGAGMWKRPLDEALAGDARAFFSSDINSGSIPLTLEFDASASVPSETGDSIVSYFWDFGDSKTAEGQIVSHTFMLKKTFAVKLTVTDNAGNKAYAYKNITGHYFEPVADFVASSYDAVTWQLINFYGELSLDLTPNDSIIYYGWDFGDGHTASGKNVAHAFDEVGTYPVKLTVRNRAYRSSSVTKAIEVGPYTTADAIHEFFPVKIYPNPLNDKLNIELDENAIVTVYNTAGIKIFQKANCASHQIFNTSNWGSGVYLAFIQMNDKIVLRKIVKQ